MASDYILEIEGIKGESRDHKHKNCVELEHWSVGCSNDGSAAHAGGAGAGKVHFQDFHCSAPLDCAGPELLLACAGGKHIKKATLYVRKQGEEQQEYLTITLEDFIVSSYQPGGSGGIHHSAPPGHQFSFNFSKIKYEYKPQKDDGSLDAAKVAGWDVKANKKYG